MMRVRPQMTAHMMKEKTNRGLSSLEESVKVALKYICEGEANDPHFFFAVKESAKGATALLILLYRSYAS